MRSNRLWSIITEDRVEDYRTSSQSDHPKQPRERRSLDSKCTNSFLGNFFGGTKSNKIVPFSPTSQNRTRKIQSQPSLYDDVASPNNMRLYTFDTNVIPK